MSMTGVLMVAASILAFGTFSSIVPVDSVCCCICGLTCHGKHCEGHSNWCGGTSTCTGIACCGCSACWNDTYIEGPCTFDCEHELYKPNAVSNTSIHPKLRFAEVDSNADGLITLQEALMITGHKNPDSQDAAAKRFATVDEDGDSQVSYAEFEKHA